LPNLFGSQYHISTPICYPPNNLTNLIEIKISFSTIYLIKMYLAYGHVKYVTFLLN